MNKFDTRMILSCAPIDLYEKITESLDPEWIGWDVETVLKHFPDHIDQLAEDKILAVKSVARNLAIVMRSCTSFEKITHALNNQPCVMDAWQPPIIESIMYSVRQIKKIAGKTQDEKSYKAIEFSGEIPGYVASCAKYYDWEILPKPLSFAQGILDYLSCTHSRCRRDGNIANIVKSLKKLSENLDSANDLSKEALVKILDSFKNDTHEYRDAARIIGCYLYRPSEI